MSWAGFLVLTVAAVLVGHLLWVRLGSARIAGRSVAHMARVFPELAAERGRAVIYCFSVNCPPCRRMTPTVERLAAQYPNLFRLDVQENPQAARSLGVRATPTTLLVEDGVVVKVILGTGATRAAEVFLGTG